MGVASPAGPQNRVLQRRAVAARLGESDHIDVVTDARLGGGIPKCDGGVAAIVVNRELRATAPGDFAGEVHTVPLRELTGPPENRVGALPRGIERIGRRRRDDRHELERRREQRHAHHLAVGIEDRSDDTAQPDSRVDQVPRKRLPPFPRQRHEQTNRSHLCREREVSLIERIDSAYGCLQFHPLAVQHTRREDLEFWADGRRQRSPSEHSDGGLGNGGGELAGIGAAVNPDPVAGGNPRLDAAHEHEDAFVSVLHEEHSPNRIEERDHACDADPPADDGRVEASDLGDPGQRQRCRAATDVSVARSGTWGAAAAGRGADSAMATAITHVRAETCRADRRPDAGRVDALPEAPIRCGAVTSRSLGQEPCRQDSPSR